VPADIVCCFLSSVDWGGWGGTRCRGTHDANQYVHIRHRSWLTCHLIESIYRLWLKAQLISVCSLDWGSG
jgi:hypothetical protein